MTTHDKKYLARHISSEFNHDLQEVLTTLATMAENVLANMSAAMDALEHDTDNASEAAATIIANDNAINQADMDINQLCFQIMALRQPVAFDLRTVMGLVHITTDLERIGDEVLKIADIAANETDDACNAILLPFAQAVVVELTTVVAAIVKFKTHKVQLGWSNIETQKMYYKAVKKLSKLNKEKHFKLLSRYLLAIKGLERINDHINNINQHFVFMAHGVDVRYPNLSLDDDNDDDHDNDATTHQHPA